MSANTKCMRKYLKREYTSWGKALIGTVVICVMFVIACVIIGTLGYLLMLAVPVGLNAIGNPSLPLIAYVLITMILFWMFTVHIAMGDRKSMVRMVDKHDGYGTKVEEETTGSEYCMWAFIIEMMVSFIFVVLLSINVQTAIWIFLIYSLGILICTPVCAAYAWCKQDPESPTDSIQQPPESETETSQDLQENPAAVNPTPQERDAYETCVEVMRKWNKEHEE